MTQFDLEQQIMHCWSVCDDIKDLREMRDTRQLSEDELDNYLLGLQSVYQLKFEKLFNLFKKLLQEQAVQKNPALGP